MFRQPCSVDPRGLRFSAIVTSAVLATVIVAPSPISEVLLVLQVAVFAVGVFLGPSATIHALIFARTIRPRLDDAVMLEDALPAQFAQGVGLAFTALGLVSLLAGLHIVGLVFVGGALLAALLNATTGFCLGCEFYLTTRRFAKHLA